MSYALVYSCSLRGTCLSAEYCIRDCTWCVVSCIDFRSLGLGLALFAVDVDGWTLSVMKCRKGIRDASLAM